MVLYKMKKSVKAISISGLGKSPLLPGGRGEFLSENTLYLKSCLVTSPTEHTDWRCWDTCPEIGFIACCLVRGESSCLLSAPTA